MYIFKFSSLLIFIRNERDQSAKGILMVTIILALLIMINKFFILKHYYFIVGEASGDLHAANLIKELYLLDKNAKFQGFGGEKKCKNKALY